MPDKNLEKRSEEQKNRNEFRVRYFIYGGFSPGERAYEGRKILEKYHPIKCREESFFWGGAKFMLDFDAIDNLIMEMINSPAIQQLIITPRSNIPLCLRHLESLGSDLKDKYKQYFDFEVDNDTKFYGDSLGFMRDSMKAARFIKLESQRQRIAHGMILKHFRGELCALPEEVMPEGFI